MTRSTFRLIIAAFVFLPFYSAHAQTVRTDRLDSTFPISSTVLSEARQIIVRVPPGYHRSTAKYPVVYMLDGHQPHIRMMEGIIDQQAFAGRIPELILVSIPNVNRDRDMTPTKTARPASGGAANFLKFIESEVFPLVETNYRTQPYRILAGHSLAGLAAINAMLSKPAMFNAYIAASPVLQWDGEYPLKIASDVFKARRELDRTLFVAVGDEPNYMPATNNFREYLEKTKVKELDFAFHHWKDEDHGTVVLRTYLDGLRHTYSGWVPDAKNPTVGALTSHYEKLTKRYGYEIKIPETILNQLGYAFWDKIERLTRSMRSKRYRALPESANTFDSLAEAYEKHGTKR
jgi:Predicted hydrolase of the alpha/beta superfamily